MQPKNTETKFASDADEEEALKIAALARGIKIIPDAWLPRAVMDAVKTQAHNCSNAQADRTPLPEIKTHTSGCSHSLEHLVKIKRLVSKLSIDKQAKYADANVLKFAKNYHFNLAVTAQQAEEPISVAELNVTSIGNQAYLVLNCPLPFRFLHLSTYALLTKCYKPTDKRSNEVLQSPTPLIRPAKQRKNTCHKAQGGKGRS